MIIKRYGHTRVVKLNTENLYLPIEKMFPLVMFERLRTMQSRDQLREKVKYIVERAIGD